MNSSVFRFKQFSVRNEMSGLKVGTDGVLIGAACALPKRSLQAADTDSCLRVLDIGTGTGLIALMLAQRIAEDGGAVAEAGSAARNCEICGIDIDARAAEEARENFKASPWTRMLSSVHSSLQDFEKSFPERRWDLIVSNPPFFENSLKAPDAQRSAARHTDTLSYRDIVSYASRALNSNGTVAMILPACEEISLIRYASSFGLYPSRILVIRTTAAKAPKRIIMELTRSRVSAGALREELVMMSNGVYTEDFRHLTGEFYL